MYSKYYESRKVKMKYILEQIGGSTSVLDIQIYNIA